MPTRSETKRLWVIALAAAVLAGATMRLILVEDMEYKADEAGTFARTQEVRETGRLPQLGLPNSLGFPHPAMGVWVFALPARWTGIDTPTGLARVVQGSSIVAILLLLLFIATWIPPSEREAWFWGVALASANPLAVLFQRKIWLPSILPLFSVLLLALWWRRDRAWAAFLWGLISVGAGQVHESAFFVAGGFALWAYAFDRGRFAWRAALAGSCLAAIWMIPWLLHVVTEEPTFSHPPLKWYRILEMKFWTYWITDALGLGLHYSLKVHFWDFLGYPLVAGRRTWFVLALHALAGVTGFLILARAVLRQRHVQNGWRDLLTGRGSPTAFMLSAAFWGYGLVLSLPGLPIHRYYMIAAFPLVSVWIAHLALANPSATRRSLRIDRTLLVTLCAAQFLITAHLLGYLHVNQGAPLGDYGVAYRSQIGQAAAPK